MVDRKEDCQLEKAVRSIPLELQQAVRIHNSEKVEELLSRGVPVEGSRFQKTLGWLGEQIDSPNLPLILSGKNPSKMNGDSWVSTRASRIRF